MHAVVPGMNPTGSHADRTWLLSMNVSAVAPMTAAAGRRAAATADDRLAEQCERQAPEKTAS